MATRPVCIGFGSSARVWARGSQAWADPGTGRSAGGTRGCAWNWGRNPATTSVAGGAECLEPPILLPGVIKAKHVSRAHLLLAGSTAVQETLPHPLPGAIEGAASRWGLALVGTCVWLPHCPDSSMATLGAHSTGCQPQGPSGWRPRPCLTHDPFEYFPREKG